jgi:hypothetical protein
MKGKKIDISKGYVFAPYIMTSTYPLDIPKFSSKVSISRIYVTATVVLPINEIRKSKIEKTIKLTNQ